MWESLWYRCLRCNSNIRCVTWPGFCICGGWEIVRIPDHHVPEGQQEMFPIGAVQGDWLNPYVRDERAARTGLRELLDVFRR